MKTIATISVLIITILLTAFVLIPRFIPPLKGVEKTIYDGKTAVVALLNTDLGDSPAGQIVATMMTASPVYRGINPLYDGHDEYR